MFSKKIFSLCAMDVNFTQKVKKSRDFLPGKHHCQLNLSRAVIMPRLIQACPTHGLPDRPLQYLFHTWVYTTLNDIEEKLQKFKAADDYIFEHRKNFLVHAVSD